MKAKNMEEWTEHRLQALISGKVLESLTLEYKSAASLALNEDKKKEIIRDVSAMANSAGGVLIYGIREYQDQTSRHLPEVLDPINIGVISKEWLEQVINNIQPRVAGIEIYPVLMSGDQNAAIYVVSIPQSHTAHQARDFRYYKRFNFLAQAMEDYEIRDIMNRAKHPSIGLEFILEKSVQETLNTIHNRERKFEEIVSLRTVARNNGNVYAMYVNVFLTISAAVLPDIFDYESTRLVDGEECVDLCHRNTARDVVDWTSGPYSINKYGPKRYEPILPGLTDQWVDQLREDVLVQGLQSKIRWSVHADNAPAQDGEVLLGEIALEDKT